MNASGRRDGKELSEGEEGVDGNRDEGERMEVDVDVGGSVEFDASVGSMNSIDRLEILLR